MPLVLEFVDLLSAAVAAAPVIVAVMTLVLLLQRPLLVVLSMLGHSMGHTYLAVDDLTWVVASVLEVNRRHLMADSLLAIPFASDPIRLYGSVAVKIAASNRLHRLALDHLANCCSSAAATAAAVFGFADDVEAAAVAVCQLAWDQAEYFDSVFVDFDTTSTINYGKENK